MTLVSLVFLISICLSIFLSGFFLSKNEIRRANNCHTYVDDNNLSRQFHEIYQKSSFHGQRPRRIFFLIVDALRLDFMTMQREDEKKSPSHNHMQTIQKLLQKNSSQCRMFGFRADSPTTTSQRLKAITTGGLPAFIEFGSNFNSAYIQEETILHRWSNSNKSVVVMGDDTWLKLFPFSMFAVAHPFDSFNTRDLYTVDDGIVGQMHYFLDDCDALPASGHDHDLNRSDCDWDVLIAHFLGVDHVGHTYSAHHPLMAERLLKMDEMVERAVKYLPDDGMLLVMGDHGMTDTGEHGGNSQLETDSALFMYSKSPMFTIPSLSASTVRDSIVEGNSPLPSLPREVYSFAKGEMKSVLLDTDMHTPRTVEQVDLAPTLSAMLGDPAPMTSLGMVIPEVFYMSEEEVVKRFHEIRSTYSSLATPVSDRGYRCVVDDGTDICKENVYHFDDDALQQCISCQAAYRSDLLAFHLHQNSIQVLRFIFEYFDSSGISVEEESSIRTPVSCIIPTALDLPSVCPPCNHEALFLSSLETTKDDDFQNVFHHYQGTSRLQTLRTTLVEAIITHRRYISRIGVTGGPSSETTDAFDEVGCSQVYFQYNLFLRNMLEFARQEWSEFNLPAMAIGTTGLMTAVFFLWSYVAFLCQQGIILGEHLQSSEDDASLRVDYSLSRCVQYWNRILLSPGRNPMSSGKCDSAALVSVGLSVLFIVFNMLSSLSNSFIIEAPVAHFFQVQSLSLVIILHHIILVWRRKSSSMHVYTFPRYGWLADKSEYLQVMLSDMAYFVLVRCMWELRSTDDLVSPIDGLDSYASYGVYYIMKAVPYLCLTALVWVTAYRILTDSCWDCVMWLTSWTFTNVLLFMIDLETTLCSNDCKLFAERCVLGASVASGIFAVFSILMKNHTFGKSSTARMMNKHVGKYNSKKLRISWNWIALSLNMLHIILIVSRRLHSSVLLALMFTLCVLATYSSGFILCRNSSIPGQRMRWNSYTSVCVAIVGTLKILLTSKLLYFITGHRYDFSTLQLDAAFVGAQSFHMVYAGTMVAINTCGWDIVGVIICIGLQSQLIGEIIPSIENLSWQKILNILEYTSLGMLIPLALFATMHASVLVGSCVGVLLLRRHLMLWAVFAPKVVFDSGFWMVNIVFALLLNSLLSSTKK